MTKIAIVDDHKMFRDGIAYVLNATEGYQVIWTADSKQSTLEKLSAMKPDVLIMDITLGEDNGIDLTKDILRIHKDVVVLGLSMHHEEEYIIKMIEQGAKGYVLKDAGVKELKTALDNLTAGGYHYNETIMNSLIQRVKQPSKNTLESSNSLLLTGREIEVLKLIVEEMSNQEISDALFISPRTVESHKRNMISKLNVKNSIGLVRYAIENDLVMKTVDSAA